MLEKEQGGSIRREREGGERERTGEEGEIGSINYI